MSSELTNDGYGERNIEMVMVNIIDVTSEVAAWSRPTLLISLSRVPDVS